MRIGIFGGSFDPVHTGHAIVAAYAAQSVYLDEVWFMVSRRNPLKKNGTIAGESDRLEMVRMICRHMDILKASDFEFSLPSPSYTYDTLCRLREEYKNHEFRLLIGGDNLRDFHKWKNAEKIINEFGIVVYPRPGVDLEIPRKRGVVFLEDCPRIGISSTTVRAMLAQGKNIEFMVPPEVAHFIKEKRLYQNK